MAASGDKPQNPFQFDISDAGGDGRPPQEYYDAIKAKFAEERDLRLGYRPPGTEQYVPLEGELAHYETDPYAEQVVERDPIDDEVEVLFIGGGFSALLTSARLREKGVESIRIVERGADVGGTWYWNRYPGVACDVVAYDYLPLLDEMDYVPTRHYAEGPEIFAHCQAIARKYDLYDLAVFQTTVTSTVWDETSQRWVLTTDRGDTMRAKFVICANGTLSKPKLARIDGMDRYRGAFLPHQPLGLRLHGGRPREVDRCPRRHHRHGGQRGADRAESRRQCQGAVRLPADAVVDRHTRRLGDRPGMGGLGRTGLAGPTPGQDHRQAARRGREEGVARRDLS